jgi:hypothetical protein
MTRMANEYERADRERDYRKHEWRPGDAPDRLSVAIPTAVEVAVLVKAIDITAGADLIEQYARTKASEARMDGVAEAYNRVCLALETPLARKEPV